MAEQTNTIRFEDGAGYERMMGTWSRLAGERFLDWVQPATGWRWVDVGCGNGVFTELLMTRCAPSSVTGVDPSPAQLDYARQRKGTPGAQYLQGDAMALELPDASFDAAAMALVLFFVPQPERGVAEMVRVVRPGGVACAYAWDILNGGFPLAALQQEMRSLDIPVVYPPSVEAAQLDRMRALWSEAGLRDVETTQITVQRTFADFEDLWETSLLSASMANRILNLDAGTRETLKERFRSRMNVDGQGRVTCSARANAVKGIRAFV